jgi:hypothetical protein
VKIILEVPETLYIKLKMVSTLSGLPVKAIMAEGLWREANNWKPMIIDYMETGIMDEEKKIK